MQQTDVQKIIRVKSGPVEGSGAGLDGSSPIFTGSTTLWNPHNEDLALFPEGQVANPPVDNLSIVNSLVFDTTRDLFLHITVTATGNLHLGQPSLENDRLPFKFCLLKAVGDEQFINNEDLVYRFTRSTLMVPGAAQKPFFSTAFSGSVRLPAGKSRITPYLLLDCQLSSV